MERMKSNSYFINATLKKYLIPTILSILGTTATAFINSLLAGYFLGQDALAAMNVVSAFTFLFAMLGCLISIGASICASVALGREDRETADDCATAALGASILLPLLVAAPLLLFFHPFFILTGGNEALYQITRDYAGIMLSCGFLTTLTYYPFNFLRLDGRGELSTLVFTFMCVLDAALVFLALRLGMGLTGFAAATMTATGAADLLGLCFLFFGKGSQVRLRRIPLRRLPSLLEGIWNRGSSSALNNLCNMLRTLFLNAWIFRMAGKDSVSIFAVACALINFTAASVGGCGQTVAPLTGVFYGERDTVSLRLLIKSAVRYAIGIHTGLFLLLLPGAPFVAAAFGMTDPRLAPLTVNALRIVAFSLIPAAVANVYIYYYMAVRYTKLSCLLTVTRSFALLAPLAWLFLAVGNDALMYLAFPLTEAGTLLLMYVLCRFLRRGNEKTDLLLIDNEIEQDEKRILAFSVPGSQEGAVDASKKLSAFCEEQELPPRLSMLLPLALEELLVLMNERCLENRPDRYSDIRVFLDRNQILLRIRCGGKLFDPVSWHQARAETMTKEELLEDDSLGIRMIEKEAVSIRFSQIFGVNHLIVILEESNGKRKTA